MDIITIATFSGTMEANLAKINIESEGIACFLADESLVGMRAALGVAMGVRLQVRKVDVERAVEILNQPFDEKELMRAFDEDLASPENGNTSENDIEQRADTESTDLDIAAKASSKACPKCGSYRIETERNLSFPGFVATVILLGLPLLFVKPSYCCKRCGGKWK